MKAELIEDAPFCTVTLTKREAGLLLTTLSYVNDPGNDGPEGALMDLVNRLRELHAVERHGLPGISISLPTTWEQYDAVPQGHR